MLQQRFGADFPIARLFADCEAEMRRRLDAGVPVKAGAAELIGELAARKLPMAVATSTVRRIAEHHLQRAGLLDHFAAVCTREDVDARQAASGFVPQGRCRKLGVRPERCIVLEDSYPRRARRACVRRDGDHGAGHAAGDRRIARAVRRGGARPARGAHDVERPLAELRRLHHQIGEPVGGVGRALRARGLRHRRELLRAGGKRGDLGGKARRA